jgi:hypothetical protein
MGIPAIPRFHKNEFKHRGLPDKSKTASIVVHSMQKPLPSGRGFLSPLSVFVRSRLVVIACCKDCGKESHDNT